MSPLTGEISSLNLGGLDAWAAIIAVIGAVVAMVLGPLFVYLRLRAKGQGFGPNSIRAMAISLFIPVLLIVTVLKRFEAETLSALYGTVAGYVLSHIKQKSDD